MKYNKDFFKQTKPSYEDAKYWLKNYVDYNTLIEFALDDPRIIAILYEHFKK